MSQSGTYVAAGMLIPGIHTITPNVGGAVGPDAGQNINISGVDPITLTGFPLLHTIEVSVAAATEIQIGVVEYATAAETIAGVANNRAVHPAGLDSKLGAQTNHGLIYGQGGAGFVLGALAEATNGQLPIGNTGNAPTLAALTPGTGIGIANAAGSITISTPEGTPQQHIYYVGAHGNNVNAGTTIGTAVLTFGQAIVLATAALPTAINRFSIVCFDDNIYVENINLPEFIDIFAPDATLGGTIILNGSSSVTFMRLLVDDATIGVLKTAGAEYSDVTIEDVICVGSGIGFVTTVGLLNCHWRQMTIENGFGVGDLSSALAHMHIEGGDIYITGTGIAIARIFTGSTVGHVDHILNIGAGAGNAISVFDGTVDISVNRIDVTDAYFVSGATSVLRLFSNEIIGTRNIAAGGTAKVWVPPTEMTDGQLVIGSTGVDPVVASLTAGANIVITPGAGSISIAASGGLSWAVTTVDAPIVVNNGYIANKAGLLTMTLPATAAIGDLIRITGINTAVGWRIAQNANQRIHFGGSSTAVGVGGYIEATAIRDSAELVCVVAGASTEYNVISSVGNITIA